MIDSPIGGEPLSKTKEKNDQNSIPQPPPSKGSHRPSLRRKRIFFCGKYKHSDTHFFARLVALEESMKKCHIYIPNYFSMGKGQYLIA